VKAYKGKGVGTISCVQCRTHCWYAGSSLPADAHAHSGAVATSANASAATASGSFRAIVEAQHRISLSRDCDAPFLEVALVAFVPAKKRTVALDRGDVGQQIDE